MPENETGVPAAGSKTLSNGIQVLKVLARHPSGLLLTHLAKELGLHRTVVYRLLGTLQRERLVTQREDGRYELGLGVIELSGAVRPNLQAAAQGPLRTLANDTGATAFLAVLDGDEVVSVSVIEPPHTPVHVAYRTGLRHSVSLGPGRAILIGRPFDPDLRPDLAKARELGYVTTHDEIQRGAWGLSAPVTTGREPAEAAVGVVALGPIDEVRIAPFVIAAARAVAQP
ncbi:IclR family transcriptional regulator [Kutzneria sp. CA-103260]|uniref:IclR family transcriptional regulator n=1 Tax=Kutzneria sp. CA-103260 TaxID=2802641 RepID=UPI001BAC5138|nr:helix-turn-helix domain-containing protein [Kutzneria sp. CA-103260]QUQ68803.1 HTH domain-containing protein [Kutzneria sp. CA-103260]